jgi:hypothetical protein
MENYFRILDEFKLLHVGWNLKIEDCDPVMVHEAEMGKTQGTARHSARLGLCVGGLPRAHPAIPSRHGLLK